VTRQAEELGALTSDAQELTSALERDVGTIVARSDDSPQARGDFIARLSDAERDLAELRAEFAKLQSRIGQPEPVPDRTDRDQ
jgi:diguanylate cyclase